MFPPLIICSRKPIAGLLIALLLSAHAGAACRNIVVSEDSAYMVLDPETLTVLQVGDLHWLGIHSAGFLAGSSFERALVSTSAFLETNSEESVIEPVSLADGFLPSSPAVLHLENLGEHLRTQSELTVMEAQNPPFEYRKIQWADWIAEDALIREIYDWDQHYLAGFELLDTDFRVLRRWGPRAGFNLQYPSCAIGDRVYFAGRSGVHVFDDQGGTMYELEILRNEGLRLVPIHARNCKALAFRDVPDDNSMQNAVLVDVVEETLSPEFAVYKGGEYVLYDDGKRLLHQRREYSIRTSGSGFRVGYSGAPTNLFSLIDTTTGQVLLERELETGSGALSREMLCDEETPLALVQDEDAFYLIDPNTLEIVASKTVPTLWAGFYHVFE